jgi:exopolyphosphatase
MMSSLSSLSPPHCDGERQTEKKEEGGAPSLASYLESISSLTLKTETSTFHHNRELHFILGNEAGDADSIISALALGYVMILEEHYYENLCGGDDLRSSNSTNTRRVVVPIASVPRADLSLRRDIIQLLELSGINIAQLPCLDDEYIVACLEEPKRSQLTLTLVDHNRIRSSLSHLSELVTEILDHHEDEGYHIETTASTTTMVNKRIIAFEDGRATVASTCTLVVERLFSLLTATLSKSNNSTSASLKIDGSLGLLLLGVILLDTINMSPTAGRGTLRDAQAISLLLEQTDWSSLHRQSPASTLMGVSEESSHSLIRQKIFPNYISSNINNVGTPNTTALFEVLSNSRSDKKFWMEASVADCLRMDYKKFMVPSSPSHSSLTSISSIGLSTVLLGMNDLMSKRNFRADMSTYATSSYVDLFGVLTLDLHDNDDGGTTAIRGLLLASFRREVVDAYTYLLLNGTEAAFLELVECNATTTLGEANIDESGSLIHIRVFQQGNARMGRKQIAPILLGGATILE